MGFYEDQNQCVEDLFSVSGKPAVHTPYGGEPVNCTVILSVEGEPTGEDRLGTADQLRGELRVRESEVPSPMAHDVFEIDGETWAVVRPLGRSAGMWILEVGRS